MTDGKASVQKNQDTRIGPYIIALLCGGTSNEREVSLASAANVQAALEEAGHTVVMIDTADPHFIELLETTQPDVAFIALHGKGGEDGTMQSLLELMNIPYTGSGVLGSALALDKHHSKIVYQSLGLKTAPWVYLRAHDKEKVLQDSTLALKGIALPVVVKPTDDGSSVGITIVKEAEELPGALKAAFSTGANVLVEGFIKGTEITVSVLGSTELMALPAIEIIPKNEFYDYESKYAEGGSKHIIPARLKEQVLSEAAELAIKAHAGLDCFGLSRTDMIVDDNDEIWIIETNTIPGMTGTSLLPDAAQHIGMSHREVYENLVVWALERAEQGSRRNAQNV